MSTSTSKASSIPKVENAPSTSINKQSIPLPNSSHSKIQQSNPTHIPSHLPLHQSNQQQKSHGIPQSQKQHIGPPRYQPPPPPSGILKNLSPQRSGIPTPSFHQSSNSTETNAHLNLKFPQEVPRLTTIYIPDRNPGTLSRIATARSLQQQRHPNNNNNNVNNNNINNNTNINNTQSQPSPHLSTTDDEQQSTSSRNHQQEMLKFVRKSDNDSVSAHSPNANPNPSANIPSANHLIRMNAAEQSRHFQVSYLTINHFLLLWKCLVTCFILLHLFVILLSRFLLFFVFFHFLNLFSVSLVTIDGTAITERSKSTIKRRQSRITRFMLLFGR